MKRKTKIESNEKLEGLVGWLAFFQVSMYVTLAILIYDAYFYDILLAIPSVCFIISLALMYQKKRIFKPFIITSLWVLAGYFILAFIIGILKGVVPVTDESNLAKVLAESLRPVIWSLIWTSYFLKSERVKNTFVN